MDQIRARETLDPLFHDGARDALILRGMPMIEALRVLERASVIGHATGLVTRGQAAVRFEDGKFVVELGPLGL